MRNFRTAFYESSLSDSENVESWEENGAKDTQTRAFERWNTMLKEYEAPPIDAATDEALQDYVRRRKDETPDAWY
jgi:trimethylamine--corrinoid protein Co-methyltransferase